MRTYAIVNRKGGVGKTTTAKELAYILATSYGKRVLFIDADSQGNATSQLLPGCEVPQGNDLAAVLRYPIEWYPDVIWDTRYDGIKIIPATEDLGDFELECLLGQASPDFNRLRSLLECIAEDGDYDNVVIDCPPYYSISCISAISAADSVIIPAGIDAYSLVGMGGLVRQINNIRKACPQVKVSGALVTQWHRSPIGMDAVATMLEQSPVPVFDTVIRRTDKAVESTWAGTPVGEWSPLSAAARDYQAWVAELLAKEGGNHA